MIGHSMNEQTLCHNKDKKEETTMDNLLKQEMTGFKTDMTAFKTDMHEMKGKVDKMFTAIIGNELLKDGGLVGQFNRMEIRLDKLETRVDELDETVVKFGLYQKLIWAGIGVTATGILSYLIQVIFKH